MVEEKPKTVSVVGAILALLGSIGLLSLIAIQNGVIAIFAHDINSSSPPPAINQSLPILAALSLSIYACGMMTKA